MKNLNNNTITNKGGMNTWTKTDLEYNDYCIKNDFEEQRKLIKIFDEFLAEAKFQPKDEERFLKIKEQYEYFKMRIKQQIKECEDFDYATDNGLSISFWYFCIFKKVQKAFCLKQDFLKHIKNCQEARRNLKLAIKYKDFRFYNFYISGTVENWKVRNRIYLNYKEEYMNFDLDKEVKKFDDKFDNFRFHNGHLKALKKSFR